MILTCYRIKIYMQIVYNFCQFVYINKQILKNSTFFRKNSLLRKLLSVSLWWLIYRGFEGRWSIVTFAKFKLADTIWWPFFTSNNRFYGYRKIAIDLKVWEKVFGVADYESVVWFTKFKMADLIWLISWRKFQNLKIKKFNCILRKI